MQCGRASSAPPVLKDAVQKACSAPNETPRTVCAHRDVFSGFAAPTSAASAARSRIHIPCRGAVHCHRKKENRSCTGPIKTDNGIQNLLPFLLPPLQADHRAASRLETICPSSSRTMRRQHSATCISCVTISTQTPPSAILRKTSRIFSVFSPSNAPVGSSANR